MTKQFLKQLLRLETKKKTKMEKKPGKYSRQQKTKHQIILYRQQQKTKMYF